MISPEVSTIVDAQEKSFMDDPRNAKRIYRRVIAQCRFVCVFIFDFAIARVLGLGPIWSGLAARNLQLHALQCHEKEHWAMTSQSAPPVTAALFALLPSTVSEYQDGRFLHWQTDEPRLAHFPSPLLPPPLQLSSVSLHLFDDPLFLKTSSSHKLFHKPSRFSHNVTIFAYLDVLLRLTRLYLKGMLASVLFSLLILTLLYSSPSNCSHNDFIFGTKIRENFRNL